MGLSARRLGRMRQLIESSEESLSYDEPTPDDFEYEDAFKQSVQEREYPEADPNAVKLRALIGSDIGTKLADAIEMAHDSAATEQDKRKKAKYLRIAETLRMTQNLLSKKVWNDLLPLLDPTYL